MFLLTLKIYIHLILFHCFLAFSRTNIYCREFPFLNLSAILRHKKSFMLRWVCELVCLFRGESPLLSHRQITFAHWAAALETLFKWIRICIIWLHQLSLGINIICL